MSLKLLGTLKNEILEQYWGLAWRDTLSDESKNVSDQIDAYKKKYSSSTDLSYIDVNNPFLIKPSVKRGSPFNQVRGTNKDGSVRLHKGIDYSVGVGTNVVVLSPGVVKTADMNADPEGYGALISILHDDGKETRYGHMSRIDVKSGQIIDKPIIIGKTGGQPGSVGAGNSQGPHLHFEVRQGGTPIDPSSSDNDNSIYRFLNDSDIDKLNVEPPSNDTESEEKYTYKKGELTVVVGGIGYATKEWMKSEWESAGLDSQNVTFINHTDEKKFDELINQNTKIIMGFSAGGSLIWKEIIKNPNKYSFIGLIDPSTSNASYSEFVNETRDGQKIKIKDMPSNVYSLTNSENWSGKYEDIKKRMASMENLGLLTKINLDHNLIPKKFFEGYKTSSLKKSSSTKSKNKSLPENENRLVEISKKYVGTPYLFGGCNLREGIDCSCFVLKVFQEFGANTSKIPRVSHDQYKSATPVSEEDLRPGDLVFIDQARRGLDVIDHVMMVISPKGSKNIDVIHAGSKNGVEVLRDIKSNSYYKSKIYSYGRFDLGLDKVSV